MEPPHSLNFQKKPIKKNQVADIRLLAQTPEKMPTPDINDKSFSKRKVPMRTLANIVDEYDIKEILLLSIDVAGFEYEVLKGIEFYNLNIKSIVIENMTKSYIGKEDIRLYLKQKNYVFTARLNDNDDVYVHQSMINGLPHWTYQPVTTI